MRISVHGVVEKVDIKMIGAKGREIAAWFLVVRADDGDRLTVFGSSPPHLVPQIGERIDHESGGVAAGGALA